AAGQGMNPAPERPAERQGEEAHVEPGEEVRDVPAVHAAAFCTAPRWETPQAKGGKSLRLFPPLAWGVSHRGAVQYAAACTAGTSRTSSPGSTCASSPCLSAGRSGAGFIPCPAA